MNTAETVPGRSQGQMGSEDAVEKKPLVGQAVGWGRAQEEHSWLGKHGAGRAGHAVSYAMTFATLPCFEVTLVPSDFSKAVVFLSLS